VVEEEEEEEEEEEKEEVLTGALWGSCGLQKRKLQSYVK